MNFYVVIPARLQSTRLPRKVLLDIAGKPMLQHVYERAKQSMAKDVLIATDSQEIIDVAESFGAKIITTGAHHPSGTDRIAEVVLKNKLADDDIVINVQGDEPLLPPELINLVAERLQLYSDAQVATLAQAFTDAEVYHNPNTVKVVMDSEHYALYFSRANIPYFRDSTDVLSHCYKHIGLYAYRAGFIKQYAGLSKSPLEQIEQLEQLRVLWHGYKIQVAVTDINTGIGVDTEEDLRRVREVMGAK